MAEQNYMETIYIRCVSCGNEFSFEPGEQRYYAEHELSLPRRCPACRLQRKVDALRHKPDWGSEVR